MENLTSVPNHNASAAASFSTASSSASTSWNHKASVADSSSTASSSASTSWNHKASAAASSSPASFSASTSRPHYDVFINHRGPDVKHTFASHLYRRLIVYGISVFLDKPEMEEGQNIFFQIEQAISGASVHLAIFSTGYAQSSWCLDELVLMIKSEATLLPIFFNVDPSVVRHTMKNGAYAEALLKLQEKRTSDPQTGEEKPRFGPDTVQSWRTALSKVADLSGFELKSFNGDEGELLDKVLQRVLKIVSKRPTLYVAQYPTGLDLKLDEFERTVLQENEEHLKPKVVGIVGVGGVGKTTLAKEFFNRKRSNYNESSFLSDVREKSLNCLQSKLLKDLKLLNKETEGAEEGIEMLEQHPLSCHALIILDDVNDADQLELLSPIKNSISSESLILVTSSDKHSLQKSVPLPEFTDLVDRFVEACNGLPLSLKVLGALVCRHDRPYWAEQLDQIQHTLPRDIEKILRISYDSLRTEDQWIFLDIVCFFMGEDRDRAIRIWGKVGLQNIQDKCLLEVDSENKINMHNHIRDMGRQIAEGVSTARRFWHSATNITNITSDLSPEIAGVHGINMVSSSVDFFRDQHLDLSNTTSSQISRIKGCEFRHLYDNLHLVATEEDRLEGILRRVQPPLLIWLRWYRYSHYSLPLWIPMTKLRVLEMEGSNLKILWPHQSQALPLDLRELNICAPLKEIPNSIGQLKCLERITIWNRSKAVTVQKLPDEFCLLRSLKYLDLKGFPWLVSLPVSFGELTNLQLVDLEGASSLQRLPDSFGKLTRLKHLSLKGCKNLTISNETLGDITMLEYLDLSFCTQVIDLPLQVAHQRSLQNLYLHKTKLMEFPSVIRGLCNLEVLKLSSDLLEALPLWLGDFNSLKILSLSSTPQLRSLPDSIGLLTQLTQLDLKDGGIECFPENLLKMNNLESLVVSDCPLRELPFKRLKGERETLLSLEGEGTMNRLNSSNDKCLFWLKSLELSRTEIRELFFEEGVCPNLQRLSLEGCYELRQLGWLCGPQKPRDLDISICVNVEDLPGPETFISLERLDVQGCKKLERIQGLWQLTSLRELNVRECGNIQALPGVEYLTRLERLTVRGCGNLMSIPGLGQLTKLRRLDVLNCPEIQELPCMENLTFLEWLSVGGCVQLKSIAGLGQLTNLKMLDVRKCRGITELTGLEYLTSLEMLYVNECGQLQKITGLGHLTTLRKLYLSDCYEIRELRGLEHLRLLEILDVRNCHKLVLGVGLVDRLQERLKEGFIYQNLGRLRSGYFLRQFRPSPSRAIRAICFITLLLILGWATRSPLPPLVLNVWNVLWASMFLALMGKYFGLLKEVYLLYQNGSSWYQCAGRCFYFMIGVDGG